MDDKTLYELCVASGFTESEWWPDRGGDDLAWSGGWCYLNGLSDHASSYAKANDARARILAGLVKWATAGERFVFRMAMATDSNAIVIVAPNVWDKTLNGTGENIIAAYLDCYRKWKESQ